MGRVFTAGGQVLRGVFRLIDSCKDVTLGKIIK